MRNRKKIQRDVNCPCCKFDIYMKELKYYQKKHGLTNYERNLIRDAHLDIREVIIDD